MLIKRSIVINGRKTSVSIEDEFWNGMHEIAVVKRTSIASLVSTIDRRRGAEDLNLSSAIRIEVMRFYRSAAQATTATTA